MNQLENMKRMQDGRVNTLKKNFNDLEDLLNQRIKVPPFGSIINVSNVKKKLNELEENVADALGENEKIVRKSQEIVKNQSNILRNAKKDSESLIERHKQQLWNEPIISQAEERAKKILTEAKSIAARILREAEEKEKELEREMNEYANKTLDEVERLLLMRVQEVQSNRKNLGVKKTNTREKRRMK